MTACARTTLFLILVGGVAQAATFTWNGGSGEWNTATNWTPNGVPGVNDTATFNSTTGGTITITGPAASVNSLTKTAAVTVTIAGPQTLTVGAGGIARTGGNAANVLNIATGLVVGAPGETWTINGPASTNTFSGAISGQNFIKAGGGTLVLSGNNSFSGARINAGTVQVTNSAALGAGTITMAGGTLSLNSAAGLSLPVTLTTAGNATLNVQGGTVTHSVASVVDNTLNTLTLTSGGGASLSVGTLTANGTVAGGGPTLTVTGTLTGSGTVNRAVTVGAGANLTPTGAGLNTGALTVTSSTKLNFTVGSTVTRLNVTGALTLLGVLNVSPGAGFAANTYTLITTTGGVTDNHTLAVPSASVPAGFNIGYVVAGNNVNLIVTVRALGLAVSKLEATYDSRHTQVVWATQQERRTLGYRLWKQDGSSRLRVGPSLVPGGAIRLSTDLKVGPTYAVDDWTTLPGGTYWIEAIGMDGQSSWLGPVTARPGAPRSVSAPRPQPSSAPQVRVPGAAATRSSRMESVLTTVATAKSWDLAAQPGAKAWVRDPGVYRIAAQALFDAGIATGVSVNSLKVSSLGSDVSFRATAADGAHLNPGDFIEFYGEGVDSRYTDTRVYWLTSTLGGGPQNSVSTETSGPSAGPSFLETVQFEDRINYFGGLKNGGQQKFFGPWVYDAPEVRTYATPAIDLTSSQAASLEVGLQGVTPGEHGVRVSLNGIALGEISGSGHTLMVGTFQVPSGLLVAGDNVVQLLATAPGDASFEAYQRLTYPRLYQSTGGPLYFTAPGGTTVRLAGLGPAGTTVLDITNPGASVTLPVAPDPQDAAALLVTVPSGGQRSLYAYADTDVKNPVFISANHASSIHSSEADLVIIAHSTLLASIQPLVSQRQAEGLRVALIDVDSVYDEFNYGQKDVSAIQDFLAYAQANWGRPPRYALLVGSASYNPRNYGGAPGVDLVPTRLVETEYSEAGSDDALVPSGAGDTPTLALGRLPFPDPDSVSHATSKILGRALVTPASRLLLVHDQDDLVSNFTAQTKQVRDGLRPLRASELWRANGLAEGSSQQEAADSALHDSLIAALVAGPAVVSYLGHGGEDSWAGNILMGEDVPALSSSAGASVFYAGTCANGDFVDQGQEFLAGALLSAPSGGAWAMVASSGATNPGTEQPALAVQLFQSSLFDGSTLGEAMVLAKSAVFDPDIRTTFTLFGDPSARMAPAKQGDSVITVKGVQSSAAGGCGTPGNPFLGALPFVALALLLNGRHRATVRIRRR